ncbi:GFA family protein [Mesorhizobium opportunistum]|uniref:GFA family protein n=1 Tax=Mesorhizobium opportunistum TaxID=593909 RepID=UPI003DA1A600
MLYKGSCHCGKVVLEFEAELTGAVRCNCSICSRKGALLCAIPHQSLRILAWGNDLAPTHSAVTRWRTASAAPAASTLSPRMCAKAGSAAPTSTSTVSPVSTRRPCRSSTSTGARPDTVA